MFLKAVVYRARSFMLIWFSVLFLRSSSGQTSQVPSLAFDVVSIKPGIADEQHRMIGFSGDSYRCKGMPLFLTLMQAFLQSGEKPKELLKLAPAWVWTEPFDIVAKLDEPSLAAFQHKTIAERQEMRRPLLVQLLQDRFKLSFHLEPSTEDGYALVVRKHGPNLKETSPNMVPPQTAIPLLHGGLMIPIMSQQKPELTFFDTSMTALAWELRLLQGIPFVDRTGLQAHYDFVLPRLDLTSPEFDPDNDPGQFRLRFDVSSLGLNFKPLRLATQAVSIDHIERPTPN